LESVRQSAKVLSGYRRPDTGASRSVFTGRFQREGYSVEKHFIRGEGDYVIPFIAMVPHTGEKHSAIIYVHPGGKASQASSGGEMEMFVKNGYTVVAPDLIGTGEMGPGYFTGDAYIGGVSYNIWFASILIGRSIAGIRAGDLIRIVDYLKKREDIQSENISAVACGEMCPVVLHAAAFDTGISKVALIEPLISYSAIVMNRCYNPVFIHAAVASSLQAFDLPDLAACIAPRELLLVDVTDQQGHRVPPERIEQDLAVVGSAYSAAGAREKFDVRNRDSFQEMDEIFSSWLK
jgi:hypothetical protein